MWSIKTPLSLGNPPPIEFLCEQTDYRVFDPPPNGPKLLCATHLSYAINYRGRPALQKPV